jgi:Protein of unknown function (DUF2785)
MKNASGISTRRDEAVTRTATDATYWEKIVEGDFAVPEDRPLDDLTVELVELLGDTDPHVRDELAWRVFTTWIHRGVYDDLLAGVGDGMCEGLTVGLGEDGSDTIFRRSFSILILAGVLTRDNEIHAVHPTNVLRWGDQGLGWFVRERDLRGFVPGCGWAHAVAHGADFMAALTRSRHLDEGGLMVILDAIADRLLAPTSYALTQQEDDRLAYATMALLQRNVVDMALLGPWVERLASSWEQGEPTQQPVPAQVANTIHYVRALHAQLLLGVQDLPWATDQSYFQATIGVRVELLGALQHALRTVGPWYRPSPNQP